MTDTPTPLPVWDTPAIDAVDLHRLDDCSHYVACMARASTERWRSFSCVACRAYTFESPSPRAVRLDLVGSRPTVAAVAGEDDEDLDDDEGCAEEECDGRWSGVIDVVLAAELVDGAHPLLQGTRAVARMRELGRPFVLAALVGRATCPICAASPQLLLGGFDAGPATVGRDGYCPVCRGFLEADASGVVLRTEERSRIAELASRGERARRDEALRDELERRRRGAFASRRCA